MIKLFDKIYVIVFNINMLYSSKQVLNFFSVIRSIILYFFYNLDFIYILVILYNY